MKAERGRLLAAIAAFVVIACALAIVLPADSAEGDVETPTGATAIDPEGEDFTSLSALEAGTYYLVNDYTMSRADSIPQDVTIYTNGNEITTGNYTLTVIGILWLNGNGTDSGSLALSARSSLTGTGTIMLSTMSQVTMGTSTTLIGTDGVAIESGTAEVTGFEDDHGFDLTLESGSSAIANASYGIGANSTVTIETGAQLTVATNNTLTVHGTLVNNGTLVISGTLTGAGTIENGGTITINGTVNGNTIATEDEADTVEPVTITNNNEYDLEGNLVAYAEVVIGTSAIIGSTDESGTTTTLSVVGGNVVDNRTEPSIFPELTEESYTSMTPATYYTVGGYTYEVFKVWGNDGTEYTYGLRVVDIQYTGGYPLDTWLQVVGIGLTNNANLTFAASDSIAWVNTSNGHYFTDYRVDTYPDAVYYSYNVYDDGTSVNSTSDILDFSIVGVDVDGTFTITPSAWVENDGTAPDASVTASVSTTIASATIYEGDDVYGTYDSEAALETALAGLPHGEYTVMITVTPADGYVVIFGDSLAANTASFDIVVSQAAGDSELEFISMEGLEEDVLEEIFGEGYADIVSAIQSGIEFEALDADDPTYLTVTGQVFEVAYSTGYGSVWSVIAAAMGDSAPSDVSEGDTGYFVAFYIQANYDIGELTADDVAEYLSLTTDMTLVDVTPEYSEEGVTDPEQRYYVLYISDLNQSEGALESNPNYIVEAEADYDGTVGWYTVTVKVDGSAVEDATWDLTVNGVAVENGHQFLVPAGSTVSFGEITGATVTANGEIQTVSNSSYSIPINSDTEIVITLGEDFVSETTIAISAQDSESNNVNDPALYGPAERTLDFSFLNAYRIVLNDDEDDRNDTLYYWYADGSYFTVPSGAGNGFAYWTTEIVDDNRVFSFGSVMVVGDRYDADGDREINLYAYYGEGESEDPTVPEDPAVAATQFIVAITSSYIGDSENDVYVIIYGVDGYVPGCTVTVTYSYVVTVNGIGYAIPVTMEAVIVENEDGSTMIVVPVDLSAEENYSSINMVYATITIGDASIQTDIISYTPATTA